jgi:hypothetical protein
MTMFDRHLDQRQRDGSCFINDQQLCLRQPVGMLRLDVLHSLQDSNSSNNTMAEGAAAVDEVLQRALTLPKEVHMQLCGKQHCVVLCSRKTQSLVPSVSGQHTRWCRATQG